MNRLEFMKQLEALLSDIPDSEKQEALQYYEDYFDDAGVESEQEVLESLGSPERIAATIKSEIGFNQRSFESDKIECRNNAGRQDAYQGSQTVYQNEQPQGGQGNGVNAAGGQTKQGLSAGTVALIVILCILASPFILSLLAMVLSVALGIMITLFALILAFGVTSISLFVCAVIFVGVGIVKMFASPLGGLVLIGAGLLSGGFALLFLLLTIWLTVTVTPAFFKGLVWLCKAPFKKKA